MSRRREPSEPPVIPGYRYSSLLGSGGFADVFLYMQELPQRAVAVKVIIAPSLTEDVRERFRSEANLMAQLSHHPSIVTIYQAGITLDRRPYLVLEYCSRPGVGARYRREHISVAEALRVGIRIASATETAHRAGIMHRDIKPANVLTTDFGWPALTDFGIASTVGPAAGSSAVGMSVPWSPPEVLAEDPVIDARSDVYSLAATVYSLLAGRSPFEIPGGANGPADLIARIERSPLTPLSRPDVPSLLQETLNRAMSKEIAQRFDSALDFARALQHVEASLGLPVTTVELSEITTAASDVDPEPSLSDDDPYTQIRPIVLIDPDGENTADTSPRARRRRSRAFSPGTTTDPRTDGGMDVEDATTSDRGINELGEPDDFDGDTRVRPDRHVPMADVGGHAAAVSGAYGGSAHPGDEAPAREVSPAKPARRRLAPLIGTAVGGTLLVGALVLIGVVVMRQQPPAASDVPTASAKPAVEAVVPTPTDLEGKLDEDGNAVFTWSNPDPQSGDEFLWNQVKVGEKPTSVRTQEQTATITGPFEEGAEVCIQVSLIRANYQASANPATVCIP